MRLELFFFPSHVCQLLSSFLCRVLFFAKRIDPSPPSFLFFPISSSSRACSFFVLSLYIGSFFPWLPNPVRGGPPKAFLPSYLIPLNLINPCACPCHGFPLLTHDVDQLFFPCFTPSIAYGPGIFDGGKTSFFDTSWAPPPKLEFFSSAFCIYFNLDVRKVFFYGFQVNLFPPSDSASLTGVTFLVGRFSGRGLPFYVHGAVFFPFFHEGCQLFFFLDGGGHWFFPVPIRFFLFFETRIFFCGVETRLFSKTAIFPLRLWEVSLPELDAFPFGTGPARFSIIGFHCVPPVHTVFSPPR